MSRNRNTDVSGEAFSDSLQEKVWKNKMNDKDSGKDECDNFIVKAQYGKQTDTGWEIDHIKPVSKGGTDHLSNLRPLQWEANRKKGDKEKCC